MKVSRNDLCPCGSGKKYKKCCLDADAARVAGLNVVEVDLYRPAALPESENRFVPAIACMNEEKGECLFVLTRPSRPFDAMTAIDEADLDLVSSPDAASGEIGPGCLRYLDKIGYRTAPGIGLQDLKLPSDLGPEDSVCEHCGEVHHYSDHDFEDELDEDDEDFDEGPGELDHYDYESEAAQSIEFFQRLNSIPVQQMATPELAATVIRLRNSGYSREEAAFMVLEEMVHETQRMKENDESEPNLPRLISALASLQSVFD